MAIFSLDLIPGDTSLHNAFYAGGYAFRERDLPRAGFYIEDGRYCFLAPGDTAGAFPGGAVVSGASTAILLGCIREGGGDLDVLTQVTGIHQYSQTFTGTPRGKAASGCCTITGAVDSAT
jgi:hypothetical protein